MGIIVSYSIFRPTGSTNRQSYPRSRVRFSLSADVRRTPPSVGGLENLRVAPDAHAVAIGGSTDQGTPTLGVSRRNLSSKKTFVSSNVWFKIETLPAATKTRHPLSSHSIISHSPRNNPCKKRYHWHRTLAQIILIHRRMKKDIIKFLQQAQPRAPSSTLPATMPRLEYAALGTR